MTEQLAPPTGGGSIPTPSLQVHKEDAMQNEEEKVQECPQCHSLCNDDVTIADHGICYDCHKAELNGEVE